MIFDKDADIPYETVNNHGWKYIIIASILFCVSFYPIVLIETRYTHTTCKPTNETFIIADEFECRNSVNITKPTDCWIDTSGKDCLDIVYNNPYTHAYLPAVILGGFLTVGAVGICAFAAREIVRNNVMYANV